MCSSQNSRHHTCGRLEDIRRADVLLPPNQQLLEQVLMSVYCRRHVPLPCNSHCCGHSHWTDHDPTQHAGGRTGLNRQLTLPKPRSVDVPLRLSDGARTLGLGELHVIWTSPDARGIARAGHRNLMARAPWPEFVTRPHATAR